MVGFLVAATALLVSIASTRVHAHAVINPSQATWDTNTDFSFRITHGGVVTGTKAVYLTLPPGTYGTKPAPAVGFDMAVTWRELDPPQGLHGRKKNATIDTVAWEAKAGYALPTWASQDFAFSTVFSPQRGVTHFRVAQLLEDNVWYNWTVGESTATPVNLTAPAPAPANASGTPAATPAVEDHSAHNHRRGAAKSESEGGDRVEDAPAVMITSPEALEKAAAPKCDCADVSALEAKIADLTRRFEEMHM